jgi:hypothetical protein
MTIRSKAGAVAYYNALLERRARAAAILAAQEEEEVLMPDVQGQQVPPAINMPAMPAAVPRARKCHFLVIFFIAIIAAATAVIAIAYGLVHLAEKEDNEL